MIIRVFPTRTNHSPTDEYCYFGLPPMWLPPHDAVHISAVFIWDIGKAKVLQRQWQAATDRPVLVGGPALDDPGGEFTPGQYLASGLTITSRGCNNQCPFCFVPKREGKIRELGIKPGNIIYDNNFTQCSRQHQQKVFQMLRGQRAVEFAGGLEAARITDAFVDDLRSLRIKEMWLAADGDYALPALKKAAAKLTPHFNRNKLRCFVLAGYWPGDTKEKAEARLRSIYDWGFLPFIQLYKSGNEKEDKKRKQEWGSFIRQWSRPAIYKSIINKAAACSLGMVRAGVAQVEAWKISTPASGRENKQ